MKLINKIPSTITTDSSAGFISNLAGLSDVSNISAKDILYLSKADIRNYLGEGGIINPISSSSKRTPICQFSGSGFIQFEVALKKDPDGEFLESVMVDLNYGSSLRTAKGIFKCSRELSYLNSCTIFLELNSSTGISTLLISFPETLKSYYSSIRVVRYSEANCLLLSGKAQDSYGSEIYRSLIFYNHDKCPIYENIDSDVVVNPGGTVYEDCDYPTINEVNFTGGPKKNPGLRSIEVTALHRESNLGDHDWEVFCGNQRRSGLETLGYNALEDTGLAKIYNSSLPKTLDGFKDGKDHIYKELSSANCITGLDLKRALYDFALGAGKTVYLDKIPETVFLTYYNNDLDSRWIQVAPEGEDEVVLKFRATRYVGEIDSYLATNPDEEAKLAGFKRSDKQLDPVTDFSFSESDLADLSYFVILDTDKEEDVYELHVSVGPNASGRTSTKTLTVYYGEYTSPLEFYFYQEQSNEDVYGFYITYEQTSRFISLETLSLQRDPYTFNINDIGAPVRFTVKSVLLSGGELLDRPGKIKVGTEVTGDKEHKFSVLEESDSQVTLQFSSPYVSSDDLKEGNLGYLSIFLGEAEIEAKLILGYVNPVIEIIDPSGNSAVNVEEPIFNFTTGDPQIEYEWDDEETLDLEVSCSTQWMMTTDIGYYKWATPKVLGASKYNPPKKYKSEDFEFLQDYKYFWGETVEYYSGNAVIEIPISKNFREDRDTGERFLRLTFWAIDPMNVGKKLKTYIVKQKAHINPVKFMFTLQGDDSDKALKFLEDGKISADFMTRYPLTISLSCMGGHGDGGTNNIMSAFSWRGVRMTSLKSPDIPAIQVGSTPDDILPNISGVPQSSLTRILYTPEVFNYRTSGGKSYTPSPLPGAATQAEYVHAENSRISQITQPQTDCALLYFAHENSAFTGDFKYNFQLPQSDFKYALRLHRSALALDSRGWGSFNRDYSGASAWFYSGDTIKNPVGTNFTEDKGEDGNGKGQNNYQTIRCYTSDEHLNEYIQAGFTGMSFPNEDLDGHCRHFVMTIEYEWDRRELGTALLKPEENWVSFRTPSISGSHSGGYYYTENFGQNWTYNTSAINVGSTYNSLGGTKKVNSIFYDSSRKRYDLYLEVCTSTGTFNVHQTFAPLLDIKKNITGYPRTACISIYSPSGNIGSFTQVDDQGPDYSSNPLARLYIVQDA